MTKILFNDFKAQDAAYRDEIREAVDRVLCSGYYIGGPEVQRFEEAFATYVRRRRIVGVANGTDAITLALMAAGVGNGDEVIVPAVSAYPTVVGVVRAGATPVFVDVSPQTGLMDPASVAEAVSKRTKAIVPVHLYGIPAPVEAARSACGMDNLTVVEDCAQAHGAAIGGEPVGGVGVASAWSFYPTKNLGAAGDAGAVATDDGDLADRIARLRNYGQSDRYTHEESGMNSRLDPIQAAILTVKLKHLDQELTKRRHIAASYDAALAEQPNVVAVRPEGEANLSLSRHLYPILAPSEDARQQLRRHLDAQGIETLIHYPLPMHKQPASVREFGATRPCPVAEDFCRRVMSLPVHPFMSDSEVETVIRGLLSWKPV